MKRFLPTLILMCVAAALGSAVARADYAVLRNGSRFRIAGHEDEGATVKLLLPGGGFARVTADQVVRYEPEEVLPQPAATPVEQLIEKASTKYGVEAALIRSVIAAESNFDPQAVSRKKAMGLMQLMPETAMNFSLLNPFDPAENIDAGTRYLKALLERYRHDIHLTLAAYNAGPDKVDAYRAVPPYLETQNYVMRVMRNLRAQRSILLPH
jgi:soluble lytic murein transglycosylase-like protein